MIEPTLLTRTFSDDTVATLFSDAEFIAQMLAVEAALAKTQAALSVIPHEAGERINAALANLAVDMDALRAGVDTDGVPTIALVKQLRAQVSGEAATYVHWGATTQDVMDTALVLQVRAALAEIDTRLRSVIGHLARLADTHRHSLMAGRTHSQQAVPITFGLKVAGWLVPLLHHRERLEQIKPRALVVQFGGAAGTLAALGDDGLRVQSALAAELNLGVPLTPWHTQRDALAEVAGWLSLVTGSLAKMAQDIILLAQSEIGELRETDDAARGGSSTMPQKHNPVMSEAIVAAAKVNSTLVGAMHQALIQEQERATGGWQIEWLALPQMFALTASALSRAAYLSEHLVVDTARMRASLDASNGLMMAEALNQALAPHMGRVEAKQLIQAACADAVKQDRHLTDVVRERTDAAVDWAALRDESTYLGTAQTMIDRVLDAANRQGET